MILGLHRQDGSEREKDDFYATGGEAIKPLFDFLNPSKSLLIRENSCGQGHLSIPMLLLGHNVISTDLVWRGFGMPGIDFLEPNPLDELPYDLVVMNPPYKKGLPVKFINKSIKIAPVVCAFKRIQFLESEGRVKFFAATPPKYVLVFTWRVRCSKNALFPEDEKSSTCYAWFIWERGFKGDPVIKWI